MNCSRYQKQMSDFLDGLLSTAHEDTLRFHMSGCSRCRLKLNDMENSIRAIKSLPEVTPQPAFDYRLSSLLTREVTRELYAASWWRSVSGAFSELGELSRQRSVQAVFAVSLLLTVTMIGGFAGMFAPPNQADGSTDASMALAQPTPFEPELAPPHPISPFSLQTDYATPLAIASGANPEQGTHTRSAKAAGLFFAPSRMPDRDTGVLTVQTMEPTTHGIRFVASGPGMRLDPSLFTDPFGAVPDARDGVVQPTTTERLLPAGTPEMNGLPSSANPSGPGSPNGASVPIRRIRISF